MQNKMSNFNYSLRVDRVGLDIDVSLRISALHFITCYGFIKIHSTRLIIPCGSVRWIWMLMRFSVYRETPKQYTKIRRKSQAKTPCPVIAGYGFSLTEEIEVHGLLICPEVSLLITDR